MDQTVKRSGKTTSTAQEPVEDILALNGTGRLRKWRRRSWIVAFIVLGSSALAYWQFAGAQTPRTVYRTVPAERGALTVEISATGTLEPLTKVEISSELTGVVRSVAVDQNQRVRAGDVLAKLDTTSIRAQVERAQSSVKAAKARVIDAGITLRETEQTLTRAQALREGGAVTEQALESATAARDRAQSAVSIAQANLDMATAELKLQQADLAKSTIHAPIDGIVLSRSVNPGQTVASSIETQVLFVIAENLDTMELKAAIDEADIGAVVSGQNAYFTVDAFPGRRFDATIRDLSYASAVTEGVVTYEARLNVQNDELLLRPGMTASVQIVARQDDGVLLVPSSAFRFSPPQETKAGGWSLQSLFAPRIRIGRRFSGETRNEGRGDGKRPLYVMQGDEAQMIRVETGANDGENTEIISGLAEGDRVIIDIAGTGQP